jgi:predicted phage terminase large subunit-like protein
MTTGDQRQRAAMQAELLARKSMGSLRLFVEVAWPILEPATPFLPNWHIDYVCEYLEAVTAGDVRRLVINMPPRYGKSLLVSVLWPCWELAQRPSTRWLFVSYAESLAGRLSLDRRRLLTSDWYQYHWGHQVRLTRDQNAKREFHTTRRGVMLATSVGGSVTGKGGGRIVIDDPHNPMQAESDLQRAHAIDFYTQTLSTRLDNPRRDAIVLVMQRLHVLDLSAECLEHGFEHLCLPARAPTRMTVRFPRSEREVVREPDTPLWPEREGLPQLDRQLEVLGSRGFSAQYQQEPVPATADFFRREWWRYFEQPPDRCDQVLQSWDLTFTDSAGSDWVVGLVACRVGACVYVLGRYKAKASFVDTLRAMKQMVASGPTPHVVLVEDSANGPALLSMLHREIRGIIGVKPEGSKVARAAAVLPQIEAGQVFLPQPRWPDGRLRPEYAWVEDFIDSCAAFPHGTHDDDVDALTQLLLRCQGSMGLSGGEILRRQLEDDASGDDREDGSRADEFRYGGYKPFPG